MKALIQCGDHFENITRVESLAAQLINKGIRPIILVYNNYAENYFLCRGFDTISLSLNDYSQNFKDKNVLEVISKNSYRAIPLREILECDIKKNSAILRQDKIIGTYKKLLRHIERLNAILETVKPDILFIWNGYTGLVANSLRVMAKTRAIETFYLERGLFKNSIFIDAQGVNGFSSLADNKFSNIPRAKILKIEKRYNRVFIPLQVQKDTNIIYNSPFLTMREFILTVYELYTALGIELIVRPHPEEVENNLNLPLLPGITITTENSVDYWIDNTDATITINSTVGLEAIIKNKPTISYGKSIYSNKSACIELNKNSDIKEYFFEKEISVINGTDLIREISKLNIIEKSKSCQILDGLVDCEINLPELNAPFNYKKLNVHYFHYLVEEKILKARNKFKSCGEIFIYTDLKHNDFLNMTYRKTDVPISMSYINDNIKKLLNKKIDKKRLSLSRSVKQKENCLSVFISREYNPKVNNIYDLVLDRYFNVIS
ncbi:capsular polysaccharide export protein, LipB/KpsS family [Atlantibacter hermannii]|uniref:capsular polysaccharide export protein, LipB/KpsS family n=1 Tax=Atlantibacter hermannii TaxID=565 RepID=UPI00289EA158|nr:MULTISPECIES: hypothetical protein [Gammaproteobacteria]